MARQTGKGRPTAGKGSRQKREAAFTRHAAGHSIHQQQFVGDADTDRAETEFLKADRAAQESEQGVVREMAEALEEEASSLSMPRSIDDAKEMFNELRSPEKREELRQKARERLASMPEPVQFALASAERILSFLMRPVQGGVRFVSNVLRVPAAMIHVLRHREA